MTVCAHRWPNVHCRCRVSGLETSPGWVLIRFGAAMVAIAAIRF
jgi:hypothetical protein